MKRSALSARRALETINFLALNPHGAYTLTELSRALDISPASMTDVLASLVTLGYVARHPVRKTYHVGAALVTIGESAAERHPVIGLAKDEMQRLADRGYEVVGGLLVGDDILIASIAGRPRGGSRRIYRGERLPLIPPFGTVFLAWMEDAEVAARLNRADVRESPAALREVLDAVRARGYAIGLSNSAPRRERTEILTALAATPGDEGLRTALRETMIVERDYALLDVDPAQEYHVASIAAPVFDFDRQVVFALVLSDPGVLRGAEIERAVSDVMESAVHLTRLIGGRHPGEA